MQDRAGETLPQRVSAVRQAMEQAAPIIQYRERQPSHVHNVVFLEETAVLSLGDVRQVEFTRKGRVLVSDKSRRLVIGKFLVAKRSTCTFDSR